MKTPPTELSKYWDANYDQLKEVFGTLHSFATWIGRREKEGKIKINAKLEEIIKVRQKQLKKAGERIK